jgi:hypothetical protein
MGSFTVSSTRKQIRAELTLSYEILHSEVNQETNQSWAYTLSYEILSSELNQEANQSWAYSQLWDPSHSAKPGSGCKLTQPLSFFKVSLKWKSVRAVLLLSQRAKPESLLELIQLFSSQWAKPGSGSEFILSLNLHIELNQEVDRADPLVEFLHREINQGANLPSLRFSLQ